MQNSEHEKGLQQKIPFWIGVAITSLQVVA
jgi:hypothetical protein